MILLDKYKNTVYSLSHSNKDAYRIMNVLDRKDTR